MSSYSSGLFVVVLGSRSRLIFALLTGFSLCFVVRPDGLEVALFIGRLGLLVVLARFNGVLEVVLFRILAVR